jgi:hypothetical protein
MANKPAKAGPSSEQAPRGHPVRPQGPATGTGGHRVVRSADSGPSPLAWVPYLIALAGVAAGLFLAFNASRDAGRGAGLIGCSLLAAGLARLVLPPRYATMLSTRGKTSDVLAFAVFGAGVLTVALMLP